MKHRKGKTSFVVGCGKLVASRICSCGEVSYVAVDVFHGEPRMLGDLVKDVEHALDGHVCEAHEHLGAK